MENLMRSGQHQPSNERPNKVGVAL